MAQKGGAVMYMKLPFKLGDFEPACYEKNFITWVLGELIYKPELRKFSSNIQKAWGKLASLNEPEFEATLDIIVREGPIYPEFGSVVLLDLIQIILFKADCSLSALEQKQDALDPHTSRRKIFNEMKKDLIFIKGQANNNLNDHVIDLILALWIFKRKKGKKAFDALWRFSLKEDWNALKKECPELFCKPVLKKTKEKKMKKSAPRIKKEKVAI